MPFQEECIDTQDPYRPIPKYGEEVASAMAAAARENACLDKHDCSKTSDPAWCENSRTCFTLARKRSWSMHLHLSHNARKRRSSHGSSEEGSLQD